MSSKSERKMNRKNIKGINDNRNPIPPTIPSARNEPKIWAPVPAPAKPLFIAAAAAFILIYSKNLKSKG